MRIIREGSAAIAFTLLFPLVPASGFAAQAQSPSATTAAAAARQIGTVTAISAGSLTLKTDKGDQVAVDLPGETKVVQLPAGSTDLKAAQPASMTDLEVGDRVLVIGSAAESPTALTARRVVLMKSTDIAKRHETEQAGWQHGTGGIVSAIDPATGTVTIKAGSRTVVIATSPSTILRRYALNSARFEDATRSTLAELHVGDQLRVRGDHAEDGSIKANEIVSGSFRHLAGVVQSVDATSGQLTVKDSKSQKATVLSVTAGTAIHQLPPEIAARFAARSKADGTPQRTAPASAPPGPSPSGEGPAARGGDLSQVVARLPVIPLSDLKAGNTIMVVGGEGSNGSVAAITILSGVEAILAASPGGGAEMTLSPWSMGGGGAEAGGSAQ